MFKKTSIGSCTLGLLITFNALNANANCNNPIAKIASMQGSVHIQKSGNRNWLDAQIEDNLCPGDMLRTSRLSRATIVRPSGSGFDLDQNTTLTFNKSDKDAAVSKNWYLKLWQGLMYIRGKQPERYDVHTPFINAVHKGTEFLVAVDDSQAEITVYDGLVSGENKLGQVDIKPGQKGVASATSAPRVQSITVKPEDAVQWALYYPPVIDTGNIAGVDPSLNPAITAYNQGNLMQALAELDNIPQSRQTPAYLTLKAGLLLTVGRVDEAQPLIAQAQQQQPHNPDALALQAIINVTKNRQQQALDLANKAVTNNPNSTTALIAQSYAQQSLFKLEDAILSTTQATRLNPHNALA